MINNYGEALEHFFQIEMLNEKGLIEYCKILKKQIFELKGKMIDLEHNFQYKKSQLKYPIKGIEDIQREVHNTKESDI